jgi:dienelactone hydrolase
MAMSEIVIFHHAQGLTPGILGFANELRQAGHVVHTPDLFEGLTFDTLEEGVNHVQRTGFEEIIQHGIRAAETLPAELVYAGFSMGVLPAQCLAQTRRGARGALLFHACVPVAEFTPEWPNGVPVQIHAMKEDPFFVADGDIDSARALVRETKDAELFLYPGDRHLFADPSLPDFDAAAAAELMRRVLDFLATT